MSTTTKKKAPKLARPATRALPADLRLDRGGHLDPSGGMCVMEAVAYVAGESHSDRPLCASPVIAAFCREWNDSLGDDDRQRLLAPRIHQVVGTRTTEADEETRAWLAIDWLVRVHTPAWLRLAGLDDHAQALESLAAIANASLARAAQPAIDTAAAATRDATRDAAGAAARAAGGAAARAAGGAATRAATRVAGGVAARAATRAATRAAAWVAARAATRAAARAAIRPTVEQLQESAAALLDAMCAVGREQ